MARDITQKRESGRTYFELTGWTILIVLLVTQGGGLRQRTWDTVLTWLIFALVLGMSVFFVSAFIVRLRLLDWLWRCFRARVTIEMGFGWWSDSVPFRVTIDTARATRIVRAVFAWLLGALYVIVACILLFETHRRFVIVIGVLQGCAIYALRRPASVRAFLALTILGIATWALASGLTYTDLSDWFLNGAASSVAVATFVASFALVVIELSNDRPVRPSRPTPRFAFFAVFLVLAAFASRSDQLLDTWAPYHRSFFVDVAQLARDGHWLLWDIPSIYGYLSVQTIALMPANNAWQALFILSSIIITIESCIIFTLWRWGRSDWTNFAFAVLMALATFGEGVSRYPYGARLYPQGSFRFIWLIGLLFVAFLTYVWRLQPRRVRMLSWIGHVIWLISLLWSFEAAVWATVVWLPFNVLNELTLGIPNRFQLRLWLRFAKRLVLRLWPFAALPIAAFVVMELIYAIRLKHFPDFIGYVEFTGAFVSGSVHAAFPLNPAGAAWSNVLLLGAFAAVLIAAMRAGEWSVTPLLAAVWLAVWATSTYYALEPFDAHVELMLAVLIPSAAIVTFVSRDVLIGNRAALFARLAIAPIAIICIASFFGQPSRFFTMTFPFMPGWTSDTLQTLPPIPPELSRLASRAGIRPGDPVLIPNGPDWTEISQGMLFPIVHEPGSRAVAYRAWAPVSPLGVEGTIFGLSLKRRQTYIDRFLELSPSGGWYVTYRRPADCSEISPALISVRTAISTNFSASLCAFAKSRDGSVHVRRD